MGGSLIGVTRAMAMIRKDSIDHPAYNPIGGRDNAWRHLKRESEKSLARLDNPEAHAKDFNGIGDLSQRDEIRKMEQANLDRLNEKLGIPAASSTPVPAAPIKPPVVLPETQTEERAGGAVRVKRKSGKVIYVNSLKSNLGLNTLTGQ